MTGRRHCRTVALQSRIARRDKVIFKVIRWFNQSVCFPRILFSRAFEGFLADGCNLRFETEASSAHRK